MNVLLWIGLALLLLWLFGWAVFQIAGFAVHLLLIIGVVLLIWWAIRRVV